MKKLRLRYILLVTVAALLIVPSSSQVFYRNSGQSKSVGTVANGGLVNGFKVPYKGENYKFFSLFDYYVLGRCYLHSDIHGIILKTYEILEDEYPGYRFRLMECSKRKGGRSFPHRTHQNGTSIDFMTPLRRGGETTTRYNRVGLWRYLIDFDEEGRHGRNPEISIDFDLAALHILTLEKVARENGYRIRKVIFETNLKDEIYNSRYGSELLDSNIYFVRSLPENINKLHDDHYHVDFVKL
ncbi:MAG: hypothetical protein ABFS10_05795 [Bacteroidota bacterium]